MFDVAALIVGIGLLIVALQLRAMLGKPFPVVHAAIVDALPPVGAVDLYAEATQQLQALGFEGPTWVLCKTTPRDANLMPLCAVFRHIESSCLVWLAPPINAATPHRLLSYWTTKFSDGRVLTSQAFDPYFEAVADQLTPAQTLALGKLDEQWHAHRAWCERSASGATPVAIDDALLLAVCSDNTNAQRARLIARGLLTVDRHGVARPGFRLAMRLLMRFWRRPKPSDGVRPIGASRLGLLAHSAELARHFAPTRIAQWSLFALSLALFVVIGLLFWDLKFAMVLLVVVAFHEFGHFAAMRAFGYRNVHMLALPLVGGVTIGVDADPSSAKRAWMSLMGPLPGIVVGWLLLGWMMLAPPENAVAADWLHTTVWVCLVVNYLNILPLPPLDGSHVVQALLPPRWIGVQTWFVLIACVIGGWIAWSLGLVILAVLAALQFFGAFSQFAVARTVRQLLPEAEAMRRLPKPLRVMKALTRLESTAGPAMQATPRISQALQVVQTLETRPMSWPQRIVIGSVYTALLVVPAAVVLVMLVGGMAGLLSASGLTVEQAAAHQESQRIERESLEREASALTTEQLLAKLDIERHAAPADEAAIAAAEQRLGRALPEELRALYQGRNGLAALMIAPVEDVDLAEKRSLDLLTAMAEDERITVWQEDSFERTEQEVQAVEPESIDIAVARQWIAIGAREDEGGYFFVDAMPEAATPMRLIDCSEGCTAYASWRRWLDQQWVGQRLAESASKRMEAAKAKAIKNLEHAEVAKLLAQFDQPTWLMRWIVGEELWRGPADADEISATEQRIGHNLPTELRALYDLHDGFAPLRLWPVANIAPFAPEVADVPLAPQPAAAVDRTLDRCFVIGGYAIPRVGREPVSPRAEFSLLWCPDGEAVIVDRLRDRTFPSVHAYFVDAAAQAAAGKMIYVDAEP